MVDVTQCLTGGFIIMRADTQLLTGAFNGTNLSVLLCVVSETVLWQISFIICSKITQVTFEDYSFLSVDFFFMLSQG